MSVPELTPGTRISRYRVVRRIGEGGMATIYLAASIGPGGFEKPCALKVMRSDFSESGDVASILLHEARFAALLHHPNIVQVFDLGKQGSEYYMVMEWVDGLSLAKLLSRVSRAQQRLPIDVCAHIGISMAWALDYLRRGIEYEGQALSLIHRDVSPSNILLSSEGSAKLTDFGIVKVLEAPATTRVGVVKGKYAYMSPEQIRGEPIDHRSDVFSLGVVLFEALTNRRLFSRKTIAATVAAIHAARVLPPSTINAEVPPELDQVIIKALSRQREDRFESAEELVRALEPYSSSGAHRTLSSLVTEYRQGEPIGFSVDGASVRDLLNLSSREAPSPFDEESWIPDESDEFKQLEDFDQNVPLERVGDEEEETRLTPSQNISMALPVFKELEASAQMSVIQAPEVASADSISTSSVWMVLGLFAASVAGTIAFWAWVGV
ncbi:MAG: serine/threonine-protein kinase [Myxococcota bacterium]